MDFEVIEHESNGRQEFAGRKPPKESLFAEQYKNSKAPKFIVKYPESSQNTRPKQLETEKLYFPELPILEEQSELQELIYFTQSQNGSARSHAYQSLYEMLKKAKQTSDDEALRFFYSPESSPITQCMNTLSHTTRYAFWVLNLILLLVAQEECYVFELLSPFKEVDPLKQGVFHLNTRDQLIPLLYDNINSFTPQEVDLVFLILERLNTSDDKQLQRLFENELIVQFENMREKGHFLTIAGRVSLRNLRSQAMDFSILPLLLGNYSDEDSVSGEILQIIIQITAHLVREDRLEEVQMVRRFLSEIEIRDQEDAVVNSLCGLAFICEQEVVFSEEYISNKLKSPPILQPYIMKQLQSNINPEGFNNIFMEMEEFYQCVPINIIKESEYFEREAPEIEFDEKTIAKIEFSQLFEITYEFAPRCFHFITNNSAASLQQLAEEFDCIFVDAIALDSPESSYYGMFLLDNIKESENVLLKQIFSKITASAETFAFLLSFVEACEEQHIPVFKGVFELFEREKLSRYSKEEIYSGAQYYLFYDFFFEFLVETVKNEYFIEETDVESLLRFIDIENSELDKAKLEIMMFYNIE